MTPFVFKSSVASKLSCHGNAILIVVLDYCFLFFFLIDEFFLNFYFQKSSLRALLFGLFSNQKFFLLLSLLRDSYVHTHSHPYALLLQLNHVPQNTCKITLTCLLYTSPSPRDLSTSRMPSSA